MSIRRAVLLVSGTLAIVTAGCGGDDVEQEPARASPAATQVATVDADKDPREITCGDLADKAGSADLSRRAQVALAAEAKIPDMSPLRAGQSIFFAMTELCKGAEAGYTPGSDAVKAVKRGEYIADLGAP